MLREQQKPETAFRWNNVILELHIWIKIVNSTGAEDDIAVEFDRKEE